MNFSDFFHKILEDPPEKPAQNLEETENSLPEAGKHRPKKPEGCFLAEDSAQSQGDKIAQPQISAADPKAHRQPAVDQGGAKEQIRKHPVALAKRL